ncbi:MAG: response regulator [Planctomycetota bacterium]
MPKLLLIHKEQSVCSVLAELVNGRFAVSSAKDLSSGVKSMLKIKPDVIIVGHDPKKKEGLRFLRYMRDNIVSTPVVVMVPSGGGDIQLRAMKMGARGFFEYPIEGERLLKLLLKAMKAKKISFATPPPVTDKELNSNLSMLETELNSKMKCFAGRNQVYLQSLTEGGMRHRPRICLKCSLRAEYGLNREVYYEFIRAICCRKPAKCKAVRLFKETRIIA